MMGELEEYYATRSKWYYNKNLIENYSPSRTDGISKEIEAKTRVEYCRFIRDTCCHLKLLAVPMATALMFCHRFFMHQSLAKNDWKTIGAACVMLASKAEDVQRKLKDVMKFAFKDEIQAIPDKSMQKVFEKEKIELLELAERVVLTTIRFDIHVNHAFRPLHDAMKSLKISNKLHIRKEAFGLIHICLHTSLVLQHEPQYIAAGSLCIATRVHNFNLPKNWWQLFDVTLDSLRVCIHEMVEIIRTRPEYAHKLANWVSTKPVSNSQPIRKTPLSVLDSTSTGQTAELETSSSDKEANVILEISSSDEPKKEKFVSKGLSKLDVAKIREAVRKRRMNGELSSSVKLEASSDNSDSWVEREIEAGIIVVSEPDKKRSKNGKEEKGKE